MKALCFFSQSKGLHKKYIPCCCGDFCFMTSWLGRRAYLHRDFILEPLLLINKGWKKGTCYGENICDSGRSKVIL